MSSSLTKGTMKMEDKLEKKQVKGRRKHGKFTSAIVSSSSSFMSVFLPSPARVCSKNSNHSNIAQRGY